MADSDVFNFGAHFAGERVAVGKSADRYKDFLLQGEEVLMEFKGIRDALVLTGSRILVIDPQGIRGKKVAIMSIPWHSITAFSVENSGTLDLDAELKVCGSGFGVCYLSFSRGTDMAAINKLLSEKVLR